MQNIIIISLNKLLVKVALQKNINNFKFKNLKKNPFICFYMLEGLEGFLIIILFFKIQSIFL